MAIAATAAVIGGSKAAKSAKGGKSGRKEKHAAQNATNRALNEFDRPNREFGQMFGGLFNSDSGPGALTEEGFGLLNRLMPGLEAAIENLTNPGKPLELGLSAPGILESLIARNQEALSAGANAGAREAQNFLPSQGGAAARAIQGIFQGSAGEGANIETSLRAQAAQQDLANRLGILGGVGQGFGIAQGATGFGLQSGLGLSDFLMQIAGQRSNIHRGLASEQFQQARDLRSARQQNLQMLGQGVGQTGGTLAQIIPGLPGFGG